MDLKLSGKHVLITGSAGDIGLETAQKYLELGAKVSLHYHNNKATLQPLLDKYPNQTTLVQANAADEKEVIEAVKQANHKFGLLHIIVVNHATYTNEDAPIHLMTLKQWQSIIDCNLTGVFLFCREFVRQLKSYTQDLDMPQKKAVHASIVIIGSTAGKYGEAGHCDYSATKSAIMYGFLFSLKNEIVQIVPRATVNCVAPGWVHTKMAEKSIQKGDHYRTVRTMPLRKIATTTDVANMILIVSSQVTGGHMSGSIVMVDGGMEGRVLWDLEQLKEVL